MGIGNFFGLLPESMTDAKLHGVELDDLTGRIAKQLYQKADIAIDGFENTDHPDNYFDLAVGNVPFGEYKLHDRRYDRQNLLIHDYFITKTMDKVRPGGIVSFVTTKGTLDKKNSKVREAGDGFDLLAVLLLRRGHFQQLPVRRGNVLDSLGKLLGEVRSLNGQAGRLRLVAVHILPE